MFTDKVRSLPKSGIPVFVPSSLIKLLLINPIAYPNDAPHLGRFLSAPIHYTRLEAPVRDKRSSLLGPFVSYREKSFIGLSPGLRSRLRERSFPLLMVLQVGFRMPKGSIA